MKENLIGFLFVVIQIRCKNLMTNEKEGDRMESKICRYCNRTFYRIASSIVLIG